MDIGLWELDGALRGGRGVMRLDYHDGGSRDVAMWLGSVVDVDLDDDGVRETVVMLASRDAGSWAAVFTGGTAPPRLLASLYAQSIRIDNGRMIVEESCPRPVTFVERRRLDVDSSTCLDQTPCARRCPEESAARRGAIRVCSDGSMYVGAVPVTDEPAFRAALSAQGGATTAIVDLEAHLRFAERVEELDRWLGADRQVERVTRLGVGCPCCG